MSDSCDCTVSGSTMDASDALTAAFSPCSPAMRRTMSPIVVPFFQVRVFCVCWSLLPPLLVSNGAARARSVMLPGKPEISTSSQMYRPTRRTSPS